MRLFTRVKKIFNDNLRDGDKHLQSCEIHRVHPLINLLNRITACHAPSHACTLAFKHPKSDSSLLSHHPPRTLIYP